jgi:hypothetical protein
MTPEQVIGIEKYWHEYDGEGLTEDEYKALSDIHQLIAYVRELEKKNSALRNAIDAFVIEGVSDE